MSTQVWWFAMTRYQPSRRKFSSPRHCQSIDPQILKIAVLTLTHDSPMIVNTRVMARRNAGIGNNSLTIASNTSGVTQNIVLTVRTPKTMTP